MGRLPWMGILMAVELVLLNAQLNEDCTTPGGQHGTCVPVRDCSFVREIFAKVSSREDQLNVLRYRCGTLAGSGKVLVCCPRLVSASGCGRLTLQNKIVGGEETEPNEFPWTVRLVYLRNGVRQFRCGGSLISEYYVLTAAHCVVELRTYELIAVRLGEWDTTTQVDCKEEDNGEKTCNRFPHRDIFVERVIPHDQYSRTSKNHEHDIALIKLSKRAPSTDSISPICVPTADMASELRVDRESFVVAGWGKSSDLDSSSIRKLKVTLPGKPMAKCTKAYASQSVEFTENQLCVGGTAGRDSCRGDSGGPLMVIIDNHWHLAGIVSVGPVDCGTEGIPGIYTRLGSYLGWIAGRIELEANLTEV
ncbi:serine protease easter-like isoform X1 [Culex pipiens pallens]|uniref:serine protease easter-like isoform X1 n=1 Tax=Culex pipiens pallens TaxID=42434 RepID=UPI001954A43D|nr:serine protease easter-like isoform X1 [Culex pipiens pallens]